MSRTAKRYLSEVNQSKVDKDVVTRFKGGIYTRMSSDRKESNRNKSFSIESQKIICKEYAIKENIDVITMYEDYEYSGTNFNRPAFLEMIDDIRNGKINCILIRDLSRLGREHLEIGRLIDKVFPFLGVRFISVDDNIDTCKDSYDKKTFEIVIKNIMNEMYARDISTKIKSSKLTRAKNGYFIGSRAPFGYKILKEENHQRLVIDNKVFFIVRNIFDMLLSGLTAREVAEKINKLGYITPNAYFSMPEEDKAKRKDLFRDENDKEWTVSTIYTMIRNTAYRGILTQSDNIVVKDAIEKIITEEEYNTIKEMMLKRIINKNVSNKTTRNNATKEYRYKDVIYGKNTTLKKLKGKNYRARNKIIRNYYTNSKENYLGKLKKEPIISVNESFLDEKISNIVDDLLYKATSKEKLIIKVSKKYKVLSSKVKKEIKELETKLSKEKVKIKRDYELLKEKRLSGKKYVKNKEILNSNVFKYKEKLKEKEKILLEITKKEKNIIDYIKLLYKAKVTKIFSKDFINALVKRIIVKDKNQVEIELNIKKEW